MAKHSQAFILRQVACWAVAVWLGFQTYAYYTKEPAPLSEQYPRQYQTGFTLGRKHADEAIPKASPVDLGQDYLEEVREAYQLGYSDGYASIMSK